LVSQTAPDEDERVIGALSIARQDLIGDRLWPIAWHELVERYIKGSTLQWANLHPHVFMENLLTVNRLQGGAFVWAAGDRPVGWVAGDDVAAVAAKVLAQGPAVHAGHDYYMSTDLLNANDVAAALSTALDRTIPAVILRPQDLVALIDIAIGMLEKCGLDVEQGKTILLPLIESTVENLKGQTLEESLTGTYARGDLNTFESHLAALRNNEDEKVTRTYLDLALRSLEIAERRHGSRESLMELKERVLIAKREVG